MLIGQNQIIKTFITNEASLSFHDGLVAKTPQEFVEKIKSEVTKSKAEGNNYEWTIDYAFSIAVTDDNSDYTTVDTGDLVNAQFTSKFNSLDSEVFYEYYHIVDKKVTQRNSLKKNN